MVMDAPGAFAAAAAFFFSSSSFLKWRKRRTARTTSTKAMIQNHNHPVFLRFRGRGSASGGCSAGTSALVGVTSCFSSAMSDYFFQNAKQQTQTVWGCVARSASSQQLKFRLKTYGFKELIEFPDSCPVEIRPEESIG